LFFNSLSGRFALNPVLDTHSLVNDTEIIKLQHNYRIKDLTPLEDNKNIISYNKAIGSYFTYSPNVITAISAMITSNARLWMYQFKNNSLLYTDIYTIYTTELLNPKHIG
jgi:hypothetical protein